MLLSVILPIIAWTEKCANWSLHIWLPTVWGIKCLLHRQAESRFLGFAATVKPNIKFWFLGAGLIYFFESLGLEFFFEKVNKFIKKTFPAPTPQKTHNPIPPRPVHQKLETNYFLWATLKVWYLDVLASMS